MASGIFKKADFELQAVHVQACAVPAVAAWKRTFVVRS
jgi:hypothetical protein